MNGQQNHHNYDSVGQPLAISIDIKQLSRLFIIINRYLQNHRDNGQPT